MTTIKDIAEHTGVSATTVSNVIHGRRNRVSEETVERIQKAIDELGYVPNLFARSLVSSSSNVIALIVYDPARTGSSFSDETFRTGDLFTIESVLRKNGYYLMFRRAESVDELKCFIHNWKVDGIIFTGAGDRVLPDALGGFRVPIVYVDCYGPGAGAEGPGERNSEARKAAEKMIEMLKGGSHERI